MLDCLPTTNRQRVLLLAGIVFVTTVPIFLVHSDRDFDPPTSFYALWKRTSTPTPRSPPAAPSSNNSDPRAFLHVVLQYSYVLDHLSLAVVPTGRAGQTRAATMPELHRRQREYDEAIRNTLSHPAVHCLHLLVNSSRDLRQVERALHPVWTQDGPALPVGKLQLHVLEKSMTYGVALAYANQQLPGQYVVIMNSDVYPVGAGWFDLQPKHFGPQNRTVFMLSRHAPRCPGRPAIDLPPRDPIPCTKMAGYGSADGFVFRAPVPQQVVEEMMPFPTYYWGAENRLAAALVRAKYGPLLNPCNILQLWHQHCSRVRVQGSKAPRINRGAGKSRVSRFVQQLPDV